MRTRIKVETKRNGEKTYYPQVFSSENIVMSLTWSIMMFPFKCIFLLLTLVCKEPYWYRHFEWRYLTQQGNDFGKTEYLFFKESIFKSSSLEETKFFLNEHVVKKQKEKQGKLDEQIVKREYLKQNKVIKTEYLKP